MATASTGEAVTSPRVSSEDRGASSIEKNQAISNGTPTKEIFPSDEAAVPSVPLKTWIVCVVCFSDEDCVNYYRHQHAASNRACHRSYR